MELRARGWSVRAAAREVGVSRSSGTNWSRGYKTYRNGVVVGFVAPLDRLAVRQVSSRYLSQDERIEIADLRQSGLSLRAIVVRLGRAPSKISRELRRNSVAGRGFGPSMLIGAPPCAERVFTDAASTPTNTSAASSPSYCCGDGAPNRSAVTFAIASPTIRRCGCATKVSIKRCISQIRASYGLRRWRRTAAHHYPPAATTAEHTSASSGDGRGSSSRCSPSTTGHSGCRPV